MVKFQGVRISLNIYYDSFIVCYFNIIRGDIGVILIILKGI